jgi:hypothetical protein
MTQLLFESSSACQMLVTARTVRACVRGGRHRLAYTKCLCADATLAALITTAQDYSTDTSTI